MNPLLRKTLFSCLKEGGRIIRRGFGLRHTIKKKTIVSIVTEVDTAAERKVVSLIRRAFPGHGILSEESPPLRRPSPYRWIIDPLDGTTNFAHGLGLCCVSIGVEHAGRIILGGIFNPITEEFFFAEKGKGSTLNGRRIRVTRTSRLIDSLLVTGFPYDRREKAQFYLGFMKEVMERSQGIRRLGAAAMDLAYVACGRFEGFWEFGLNPWDIAAGMLIVQEAGGKVSDFSGKPVDVDHPRQMLASNSHIHGKMLVVLKKGF